MISDSETCPGKPEPGTIKMCGVGSTIWVVRGKLRQQYFSIGYIESWHRNVVANTITMLHSKGNKHVQRWCLLGGKRYDVCNWSCSRGHYHVWETVAFTGFIMQGNIHTWVGKGKIRKGPNRCQWNGETWVICPRQNRKDNNKGRPTLECIHYYKYYEMITQNDAPQD